VTDFLQKFGDMRKRQDSIRQNNSGVGEMYVFRSIAQKKQKTLGHKNENLHLCAQEKSYPKALDKFFRKI
jgi:hypothetical protein